MRDHPIFERFDLEVPRDDGDFHVNNVGCRTLREYEKPLELQNFPGMLSSGAAYDRRSGGNPHLPEPLSEDYYEWIDLLTAIAGAKDHFVMVEVGAGYGRWMANAAQALERFRGSRITSRFFCGVEMQDRQFDWMVRHLDLNGVTAEQRLLLHGGVSDAVSYELMPVRDDIDYGTGMLQMPGDVLKSYFEAGTPYLQVGEDQKLYKIVKVVPLSDVLRDVVGQGGAVDIMHVDIQGAEQRAIPASIDAISRQVKRLHIGTHGREIENVLLDVLGRHGWIVDRYYPSFSQNEAEFGTFAFLDGIISARNSRFVTG